MCQRVVHVAAVMVQASARCVFELMYTNVNVWHISRSLVIILLCATAAASAESPGHFSLLGLGLVTSRRLTGRG
jgi:hypothetical protein